MNVSQSVTKQDARLLTDDTTLEQTTYPFPAIANRALPSLVSLLPSPLLLARNHLRPRPRRLCLIRPTRVNLHGRMPVPHSPIAFHLRRVPHTRQLQYGVHMRITRPPRFRLGLFRVWGQGRWKLEGGVEAFGG